MNGVSMREKVVVITGASSGIGAATARLLAREGSHIVVTARSEAKLRALVEELGAEAGAQALAVPGDITRAEDVERLVSATLERFGRIDVLMANAGIYVPGDFATGEVDAYAQMINVNITGVLRIARAVLPSMLEQGSGDILVTSSISGHIDIPWEPVYSATKHAIQTWAHGVRRQVLPSPVRVMTLGPGMVANELWGIHDAETIAEHVRNRTALTSDDCAEAALFMLTRPPHVTIRDLVMLPQNQDL